MLPHLLLHSTKAVRSLEDRSGFDAGSKKRLLSARLLRWSSRHHVACNIDAASHAYHAERMSATQDAMLASSCDASRKHELIEADLKRITAYVLLPRSSDSLP